MNQRDRILSDKNLHQYTIAGTNYVGVPNLQGGEFKSWQGTLIRVSPRKGKKTKRKCQ